MAEEYHVLLAGSPNVGKSTLFNALTGSHQHTGNWAGVTVDAACGRFRQKKDLFVLWDLPGMYSLDPLSPEEAAAAEVIYRKPFDCTVIVADAGGLNKSIGLMLRMLEICCRPILCLNLRDEAEKNGIFPDEHRLSEMLGVPVVSTSATTGQGLGTLRKLISDCCRQKPAISPRLPEYTAEVEKVIASLSCSLSAKEPSEQDRRKAAVHILGSFDPLKTAISLYPDCPEKTKQILGSGIGGISIRLREENLRRGDAILRQCQQRTTSGTPSLTGTIDKAVTSRRYGIPLMFLLLGIVFFLTIVGAGYPSEWLEILFEHGRELLKQGLATAGLPEDWISFLADGMFAAAAEVTAVMLPPMMIFFPLFALLEDVGYLPRVAFLLDPVFAACGSSGQQSLTHMMGFGCNACGVMGCRIMSDRKQRKIAAVTNVFAPCNGRFPTLIAVISLFLVGSASGATGAAVGALWLTGVVCLGLGMALLMTRLLSFCTRSGQKTVFVLELPPYRKPQILKTLWISLRDKTLAVLKRALLAALPAGALLWLLTHIVWGDRTLIEHLTVFLDPLGKSMGLDGTILSGFLLGFPANETVMPIILMMYAGESQMALGLSPAEWGALLLSHGWTEKTAVCMLLFTLMHFPCAAACFTIKKETGSRWWTLLALLLPTVCGIIGCWAVKCLWECFG